MSVATTPATRLPAAHPTTPAPKLSSLKHCIVTGPQEVESLAATPRLPTCSLATSGGSLPPGPILASARRPTPGEPRCLDKLRRLLQSSERRDGTGGFRFTPSGTPVGSGRETFLQNGLYYRTAIPSSIMQMASGRTESISKTPLTRVVITAGGASRCVAQRGGRGADGG